jgi:homoserine kinase
MPAQVTVAVPASTSNLGPGFDCLGMALALHNRVTMAPRKEGLQVTIRGEGQGSLATDSSNLVVRAAKRLFKEAGGDPGGLQIFQRNEIPVGSGLGSSAAAVLGGLLGANALAGKPLGRPELLSLAAEMEGHPDNAVPALYGGLTLVIQDGQQLIVEPIDVPAMKVVVVLPDYILSTAAARAALPERVLIEDAIFNASRLAALVRALAAGDYERLQVATQDRLHQPYRLPLIPGMPAAFEAATAAGASAVALSGAGPSVVAFGRERHEEIGRAVGAAFAAAGLDSRSWMLPIESRGARVIDDASFASTSDFC